MMGGGDESEDRCYASDDADGVHSQGGLIQPWIAAGRMPRDLKGSGSPLHAGYVLGARSTDCARPRIVKEERNDSRQKPPTRAPANRNPLSESE
jgi:hypothetical protein